MFELEDPASGFHDGFLNKYTDTPGPVWDCYISDSLQDMIDIDIRSEVANVVGSSSNELSSLLDDLPGSLDHANDGFSSILSSNSASNGVICNDSLPGLSTAWFGGTGNGLSWSSSSDLFPDVGACVNPISVMPLISSATALLHKSPKINLNANGLGLGIAGVSSPTASPNANDNKSHLAFSTSQMKIPANALRNEQLLSHIPKQIVAISSSVTSATTAPATLATNSALQRKVGINAASVDAVKKDLNAELRKTATNEDNSSKQSAGLNNNNSSSNSNSNGLMTNTIKLGPGIGGLTFANSITYNKLKQQSSAKSPQGSPVTANGNIVLKRERDASPLHNMSSNVGSVVSNNNNNNGTVNKVLSRNNNNTGFAPKSIASSAHSPHLQHATANSPNATTVSNSLGNGNVNFQSIAAQNIANLNNNNNNIMSSKSPKPMVSGGMAVKHSQQKNKPMQVESEFPKPAYSYSCLIALALKNSRSGSLPVSEIYSFMCEHFPYFKTAPSGWKNSVRHNLSLNKCFEKIEKPATNGSQRKGCLWAMNPERITKMDEEIQKWSRKDPSAIRNAMVFPEHLEALERGEMKHGSSADSDVELDSQSEIEENSDIEEQDLDENIMDNLFVEEDMEEDEEDEESEMIMHNQVLGNDIHNLTEDTNDNGSNDVEDASCDEVATNMLAQHGRDYDIEVQDIYDTIDLDDDKEDVRMAIAAANDIIELSPNDMNSPQQHHRTQQIISNHNSNSSDGSNSGYQSPKRARLNVNYSFGPAGELAVKLNQQQQQQQQHQQSQQRQQKLQPTQFFKQIKLQNGQQTLAQLQNQSPQQHVLVQTISNGNKTFQTVPASALTAISAAKLQQLAVLQNQNRRKMPLVNRIV